MIQYSVKRKDNLVFVSFPYDSNIVSYIKNISPRKWHPEDKTWELDEAGFEKLKKKFPGEEVIPEEIKPNETESAEFMKDIIDSINKFNKADYRVGSPSYKPSKLHCIREMIFNRAQIPEDPCDDNTPYYWSQAAGTGTARHENIQSILERMTAEGSKWQYVDVGEYVQEQQNKGFCKEIRVGSRKGSETHLYNDTLHLSFFADGIVKNKETGEYFLFEFKNKVSKKAIKCNKFPDDHYSQVVIYCECLNLSKVFLLVENRDTCELVIPPTFIVTDEMKKELRDKILLAENYVQKKEIPAKPDGVNCHFCPYKQTCTLIDNFDHNPLLKNETKV